MIRLGRRLVTRFYCAKIMIGNDIRNKIAKKNCKTSKNVFGLILRRLKQRGFCRGGSVRQDRA